ncbi:hypothetical protein LOD99_3306 [Oopsacas minuta]|uniref:Uncharacterized protein n=1 Tax=Oopsacas minuta TaxID=111878 RepID=A0AAV7JY48_9METZ|nr:hypothetical protein LOD99_3306 [Oopsacas minuta]
MFQFIPGGRRDVTSYTIREMDEQAIGEHPAVMMPESLSAFTIASESTLNSTLPRDVNRDEVVTPLSGNHWSYLFYVNEAAHEEPSEGTSDRDSVYSGIPGYSYVDYEKNTELTAITSRSESGYLTISNENYSNHNNDQLLELGNMGIDKELAVEMFANQSVEQQDRPCRISNTVPHSYKPQCMQSGNLEMYPKRKLIRTTAHELRGEIRTPPHLRILQLEGRPYRKPVIRGQSNPLEPLREVRMFGNHYCESNLSNSTSVPLKLSDLHSLKLSQSSSQLNKASLSPQNSMNVFSPTNLSVTSGDTGYASTKAPASGISQHSKVVRNSSLRQSFRSGE